MADLIELRPGLSIEVNDLPATARHHRHDVEPKETKPAFQDKQLEMALEYLRGQIKISSRLTAKKAG